MNAQSAQNMDVVNSSNKNITIEACVETFEQAVLAEKSGAHRIELCGDLSVGGITPTLNLVEKVRQAINIPIMAMVRPRGGSFVFSDLEMTEMLKTIESLKSLDVYGVVIGNLNSDSRIELNQTKVLANAAQGMEITFHKAIDVTPDILESVEAINGIKGISRILTSGGEATAEEGAKRIREMIKVARPDLKIISAGKVTQSNLQKVHEMIGGEEYHGRRIVF